MIRPAPPRTVRSDERGATLLELMVALVVVALGVLAVSQLFPAGARTQTRERMTGTANFYAQERLEQLSVKSWGDADLSLGRHPAGTATESPGNGSYGRWYDVTAMAAPSSIRMGAREKSITLRARPRTAIPKRPMRSKASPSCR